MERWTLAVLRFRWLVIAAWLVALVISVMAMSGLSDLLTNRFVLPGSDTQKAEKILEEHFGQAPTGSFTLVAKGEPGSGTRLIAPLRLAAERAAQAVPTGRVAGVQPASGGVATALIVTELELADVKGYTQDLRDAAGQISDARLYVTGQAAIEHDLDPVFARDLQVGELYIAIPIAIAILVFVFGTLAFLIPFMVAAFAIPASLGIIWIFAHFMELSTYLQNLVMLIGLGIAIDYSLLMVYRYREELRGGAERSDAIVRTMQTSGRAVIFSGTAVAIGLAAMLFMPLPFMRGFGLGGLVIPLVSVLAAMTLLPVLLQLLGARLDRVRLIPRLIIDRRADEQNNFWARLSRAVMRRPVPFAAGTVALLLLLAAPVLDLKLSPGSNEGIPKHLEAVRGFDTLTAALGAGATAPTEIVIDTGRAGGATDAGVRSGVQRLTAQLEADPEVAAVRFGEGPQYVDPTKRYLHLQAIGRRDYGVPESQAFARRLRSELVPAAGFPSGVEILAGGAPAGGIDFLDMTYGAFPWLIVGVLVLTYFLLMRAFRSLLLPLKAIILNLLSIGAAYGLLVVFFKWGLGEPFGIISFDQIEGWIPVFLFAMLFGLSMDYEVFLVSRMREEWDATGQNDHAVALGLAKTGRLVTAAGLVMFAAFMGFVAGSIVGLQEFGFGLAAAVLIDVTIIRALLVPSAMKLFGRWNWWLPDSVARIIRVAPSPLHGPPAPALKPAGK
ncbi:MAG: MMPL family transporter [Actinobacteria bacterium]|nr:MMPL family transporter [Actinomycetota bacterium]HEV8053866.1 MMPL family transporter [Candidatus Limnocylindrales bacterium]